MSINRIYHNLLTYLPLKIIEGVIGKSADFGCSLYYFSHQLKSSKEHRQRVFIEAGAYDGSLLSNSLHLELKLNWTGMLVEPDPKAFQIMKGKEGTIDKLQNAIQA